MNWAFERGLQAGSVAVVEAVGESPEATAAIWRYLLDIDWLARVKAGFLPVDHPLLLLAAEPRRLGFTLRDGVRVRLLDVKAALSARSYQDRGFVVIEVIDEFCPWNAGRWRIGAGGVDRTDEAPDLRCDVSALGSVYLGGFTGRSWHARSVSKRSSLTLLGSDSVIIAGTTTSGCVRATVVDAFSLNYRVILAEEGCFDRSEVSRGVSLCDMHAKYADVIPTSEILSYFDQLLTGLFDLPTGLGSHATSVREAAE
jgi:hypothetical protein